MIWDSNGVRGIKHILTQEHGLDLTGWELHYGAGISADGKVLAGAGLNPEGQREAWIAVLPSEENLTDLLEDLIEVTAIVNEINGINSSLDSKLESALESFTAENADQRQDAVNKLESFIKSVEAQKGKKISEEDADLLIDAANSIIQKAQE
ncbi:MAG: hypothetical protein WD049_00555 [Candidatus Paceibacterota bacterium]